MIPRRIVLTACVLTFIAATAFAQTPPQAPGAPRPPAAGTAKAPPPPPPLPPPGGGSENVPPPPPPAAPRGQSVNIKVDITITESRDAAAPTKKTLAVIVADGQNGMIRSEAFVNGVGSVPLHVDAQPMLIADSKIRLRLRLQYDFATPAPARSPGMPGVLPGEPGVQKTQLAEDVTLILENGKPIVATQSADPMSDRQVTVEVRATVLR